MHADEKAKIRVQPNGDKALEERLTKAACYEVKCWAEYPVGSAEYNNNYVSLVEAGNLVAERQWVSLQKEAVLFQYTALQKMADAVKSDPVGVGKDMMKTAVGAITAKTGATICGTTGVGCATSGGWMIAFGLSDMGEGADGLYKRFNGVRSPGLNVLRYGFTQLSPTWGDTAYDSLNLSASVLGLRVQVPLKMGLSDGLGRPNSMFDVTVRNFDNAKLVPFLNHSLPFGTNQAALIFGVASKGATVVKDVNSAEKN